MLIMLINIISFAYTPYGSIHLLSFAYTQTKDSLGQELSELSSAEVHSEDF